MSPQSTQPAQPERDADANRLLVGDYHDRLGRITVQLATGMAMTLGCRAPRNAEAGSEG